MLRLDRDTPQPGVVPLLQVIETVAAYASEHHPKRPSKVSASLPIWHSDISQLIEIRNRKSVDALPVFHVFPVLFVPDLL